MVEIQKGPADPVRAARFQVLAREFDAATRAQDIPRALGWAKRAMEEGFAHPAFFNLIAYLDIRQGRVAEAIALLRNGLVMAPNDANLLNQLGVAHNHLGQYRDAIRAFDKALAAVPGFAPPLYNRGLAHEGLGDAGRARADYLRAVESQPGYAEALSRLAYTDALRGQYEAALAFAERALGSYARDQLGAIAAAMAEIALDRPDSAIARLTALLNDPALGPANRVIALGLLGDAFDAKGAADAAFDAYARSNEAQRRDNESHFRAGEALQSAQMLRRYFETAPGDAWSADRDAPRDPRAAGHVFLVGFPRSGTTLLEQTLAGHPDVVTSEERDLLADAAQAFARSPADLDTLSTLAPDAALRYRDLYWARTAEAGLDAAGKVFVDKLPLNALLLPLVAKIFPDARILFALRDPRDVILSSFRRRFAMSDQMYQLLTLEGAAVYYDAVMGACAAYREKLGLDWRDVRHEDFVADFEGQARALCGHLGLSWNRDMIVVAERLRARAVDTPSSRQIAAGVSAAGVGAWRRYGGQLAPVLPVLAPWVARFGYPE
ncbi:MAG: sulfotransferase [Rhizomicrobium sp.]